MQDFILSVKRKSLNIDLFNNINNSILIKHFNNIDINSYNLVKDLESIYVEHVLTKFESYKNNIIFIIIILIFLDKHFEINFSLFNNIIFNKISKYTLDSNVYETYKELFKNNKV